MNELNTIYTSNLILKIIDETCAFQVLDYMIRNKDYLGRWEPIREPYYYTEDTQRKLLSDDCDQMERGQMFKVWIYKTDQPERIIGSVSLSNIVRGAFQSCHLGYRLDTEEHSKGYMSEAITAMIDVAFRQLKLHRIEANIIPHNKASIRVVEKLGFQHEGLSRKYLKINGRWEDHIHMVLLNEEME